MIAKKRRRRASRENFILDPTGAKKLHTPRRSYHLAVSETDATWNPPDFSICIVMTIGRGQRDFGGVIEPLPQ